MGAEDTGREGLTIKSHVSGIKERGWSSEYGRQAGL